MIKKTKTSSRPTIQQKLSSWFWCAPIKFAFLTLLTMIGAGFIYAGLSIAFGGGEGLSGAYLMWLFLIAIVFSIYKLVKWLPSDNLDRRSYVAIDNGLTIIYFIASIIPVLFFAGNPDKMLYYATWLQYYSMPLFFTVSVIISLVYLFLFGNMIASMCATYKRARAMGVSRWKLILSTPFSLLFFWFPGYMLTDNTKAKPVADIKCKWFSDFTNWVIARPRNGVIVLIATLLITFLVFDPMTSIIVSIFAILFGIWTWVAGVQNMRKNIGGAFATFLAAINIVILVGMIFFGSYLTSQSQPEQIQFDAIELASE